MDKRPKLLKLSFASASSFTTAIANEESMVLKFGKCLMLIAIVFCSARALGAVAAGPSYTATLAKGNTLTIKAKNIALYSLLGLPLTTGQNLRGSVEIGVTVLNGSTLLILTSNLNMYSYSVFINGATSLANAKGKNLGETAVKTSFTFSARSDELKSQLAYSIDISGMAPSLPQTAGKKSKATLAGTSQFTLIIGSATFVGVVDAKGKVTFSSP